MRRYEKGGLTMNFPGARGASYDGNPVSGGRASASLFARSVPAYPSTLAASCSLASRSPLVPFSAQLPPDIDQGTSPEISP